jgi:hypothetical protein
MTEQNDRQTRGEGHFAAKDFSQDASDSPLSQSGNTRWRWLALSGLTVPVILAILGVFVVVHWWFEIPREIRIGAADAEKSVYHPCAVQLCDALVR